MDDQLPAAAELREALRRVVHAGESAARTRRESGSPVSARTDAWAFAEALADTDDAQRAAELAAVVADAHDYGRRPRPGASNASAGRRFDAAAIHGTGLAAAILAGLVIGEDTLEELAGYLAGPAVEMFRLLGIDADIALGAPLLVDGWELFAADEVELRRMLPIPSVADLQPKPPWDPARWAGMVFLRQAIDEKPTTGWSFVMPQAYPEWEVWRPLLVLALVSPDVVTMWSDHEVEPGRHVLTRLDRVFYDLHGSRIAAR